MAGSSFRDRFFSAPVARAIMSPLGLLLFGGVSAGTILAGVPVLGGLAIGAGAWAAKVGLSLPRGQRRERIDAFALSEPWKQYVIGAQTAKLRFDRTVAGTRNGAIKDRLATMAARLDDGIADCWRIANRGNEIDRALRNLNTLQAQSELSRLLGQSAGQAPSSSLDPMIASLQAQVQSAQRMQTISQDAGAKLQVLDARLNELVARATEVSVGTSDSGVLGDDIDGLLAELESLRQALEVTDKIGTDDPTTLPTPLPTPLPTVAPVATPPPPPTATPIASGIPPQTPTPTATPMPTPLPGTSNPSPPPSQGQTWPPTS